MEALRDLRLLNWGLRFSCSALAISNCVRQDRRVYARMLRSFLARSEVSIFNLERDVTPRTARVPPVIQSLKLLVKDLLSNYYMYSVYRVLQI